MVRAALLLLIIGGLGPACTSLDRPALTSPFEVAVSEADMLLNFGYGLWEERGWSENLIASGLEQDFRPIGASSTENERDVRIRTLVTVDAAAARILAERERLAAERVFQHRNLVVSITGEPMARSDVVAEIAEVARLKAEALLGPMSPSRTLIKR